MSARATSRPCPRRDPQWRGRNDERNAAYSDVFFSSGMRRSEGGSLLTIELPEMATPDRLYFDGRFGREATKSRRERTFYVSADLLHAVWAYVNTTRRAAVRRAQAHGRYELGAEQMVVVTGPGGPVGCCTAGSAMARWCGAT